MNPFLHPWTPAAEETVLMHWAVTNTREADDHKRTLCSAYKKIKCRLEAALWFSTCLAASAVPSNRSSSSSNSSQFRKLGVEAKTYNPSIWEAWAQRLQIQDHPGPLLLLWLQKSKQRKRQKPTKNVGNLLGEEGSVSRSKSHALRRGCEGGAARQASLLVTLCWQTASFQFLLGTERILFCVFVLFCLRYSCYIAILVNSHFSHLSFPRVGLTGKCHTTQLALNFLLLKVFEGPWSQNQQTTGF